LQSRTTSPVRRRRPPREPGGRPDALIGRPARLPDAVGPIIPWGASIPSAPTENRVPLRSCDEVAMPCPGTNDSHLDRAFHPDPPRSPPAARDSLAPASPRWGGAPATARPPPLLMVAAVRTGPARARGEAGRPNRRDEGHRGGQARAGPSAPDPDRPRPASTPAPGSEPNGLTNGVGVAGPEPQIVGPSAAVGVAAEERPDVPPESGREGRDRRPAAGPGEGQVDEPVLLDVSSSVFAWRGRSLVASHR
jgi:hypothetical protein